jgi:glycosyltransferase involved in cell wall biosynthesis
VLRLTEKPLGYRLQVRRALASADAVTVGSAHLLDAAVAAGAKRSACVQVGWGVDTDRFARDRDARSRLRAEWGLEDRIVVLSTRQLHALYRVDAIVRALAIARRSVPQLALVIVADGPERQPLERLVEELGLRDSVRFAGGVWTDEWPAMPDIHSAADVYCSVPETDGGPLSVLEAMAAGLPVVSSDVPVLREWVAQTGAGLLWSDGTDEGLARLLADATRTQAEMGAAGRAYVLANHRRETEMDRARELYDALVRRPH